ncbi:endolytic transglycosylase MltG [Allonocardiopsis opalescens]|nr:endolytic transglycosylase MltG [Allonocardiopsis opalescens]
MSDISIFRDDDEDTGGGRSSTGSRSRRHQDRRRRRRRRRRKGMSGLALAAALLVLAVVIGGGGYLGYGYLAAYFQPPDFEGAGTGEPVTFQISDGETGADIGQRLVEAGIVASVRAFTNEVDDAGAANELAPGFYELQPQMSAEAALAALLDPEHRIGDQVTLVEGLRLDAILAQLAENTEFPLEEWEAAAEDTDALELPEYAETGPEGYLFPQTYAVEPDADPTSVLNQMLAQYQQVATEIDLEGRSATLGYSPHEIMTIASIVQAESGRVEDMDEIARVIYNRLDIGRELQMDSTVMYALGDFGIAASYDQLDQAASSPYSTYANTGLPPGPIGSPGADAIEAALSPAEGDWIYFVATDPENGITEFAETEEEFNALVDEFEQSQQGGG